MLEITIPSREMYDESKNEFVTTNEITIKLEHSLVSISKWEAKWHKAFLGKDKKTMEETLDYIKCMTLTQNVDSNVYNCLSPDNIEEIKRYIEDPYTATYVYEDPNGPRSNETITSELIYYWMVALNIPFECQKWHLNRLLTLIKVCNKKNAPPKKMSHNQLLSRNAALNAARKKQFHTKG